MALVTGAMGALGPAIVRHLHAAGYRVYVLDLQAPSSVRLPEVARAFPGDITDVALLRDATKGVDLIVHLAAKLHVNNPDAALRPEYWRVNVEGTRRLAEAAACAKVRRFILASTICVYGSSCPPEVLDEDSPVRCDSWYAETKYEAEQIALQLTPTVVLRFAAAYGPQMKGNYVRLLHALGRGRFLYVGSGANRRTLVFDEDVARAVLLAAKHPRAVGNVYNVSDGEIHSFREIVAAMCQALGRRPPRMHLPVRLVRSAAALADLGAACTGRRPPAVRKLIDKLVEDVAVSDARIERELQYRPQVAIADGWKRVAARQPQRKPLGNPRDKNPTSVPSG